MYLNHYHCFSFPICRVGLPGCLHGRRSCHRHWTGWEADWVGRSRTTCSGSSHLGLLGYNRNMEWKGKLKEIEGNFNNLLMFQDFPWFSMIFPDFPWFSVSVKVALPLDDNIDNSEPVEARPQVMGPRRRRWIVPPQIPVASSVSRSMDHDCKRGPSGRGWKRLSEKASRLGRGNVLTVGRPPSMKREISRKPELSQGGIGRRYRWHQVSGTWMFLPFQDLTTKTNARTTQHPKTNCSCYCDRWAWHDIQSTSGDLICIAHCGHKMPHTVLWPNVFLRNWRYMFVSGPHCPPKTRRREGEGTHCSWGGAINFSRESISKQLLVVSRWVVRHFCWHFPGFCISAVSGRDANRHRRATRSKSSLHLFKRQLCWGHHCRFRLSDGLPTKGELIESQDKDSCYF